MASERAEEKENINRFVKFGAFYQCFTVANCCAVLWCPVRIRPTIVEKVTTKATRCLPENTSSLLARECPHNRVVPRRMDATKSVRFSAAEGPDQVRRPGARGRPPDESANLDERSSFCRHNNAGSPGASQWRMNFDEGAETAKEQLEMGRKLRTFTDGVKDTASGLKRTKPLQLLKGGTSALRPGGRRPERKLPSTEFMEQHRNIKERLAKEQDKMRFVFRPGHSSLLNTWDVVTFLALIYTAAFTPFEVAFLSSRDDWTAWFSPLFIINRVLDVVFLTDLIFQFFISYQRSNDTASEMDPKRDDWVDSRSLIARRYLRGWFTFDILTLVPPAALDIYPACQPPSASGGGTVLDSASILRSLRALRLVKLLRLARALPLSPAPRPAPSKTRPHFLRLARLLPRPRPIEPSSAYAASSPAAPTLAAFAGLAWMLTPSLLLALFASRSIRAPPHASRGAGVSRIIRR